MRELSAGAIIFHRSADNKIEYLLLKHELGHWDFPKGHIEAGETIEGAASREIEEETGLKRIKFIPGFKEHIKYFYKWPPSPPEGVKIENRFKVVTFLLVESKTKMVKISHEHLEARWVLHDDAMKLCKFKNQKELLKKAKAFVLNN